MSRSSRPAAADVAQARLFAALLDVEIEELRRYAEAVEARWMHGRPPDARRPDGLARQHARVEEVRCLLAALHQRFLSG